MQCAGGNVEYRLILAVRSGSLQEVKELISSYGLSYSQAWSEGYVLLRDALERNDVEVGKLLLNNGSKVNSKSSGRKPSDTPLHFAAVNGNLEIVEMLLDRGANLHAENKYGFTPLHRAVDAGKAKMLEYLLKRGARSDVTTKAGWTPLHLAAKGGCLEIVEILLRHGADVNSANKGDTPLSLAIVRGDEKVVNLLLLHGANVDYPRSMLNVAVERGRSKIVEHVLKYCPDQKNQMNRMALTVAVSGVGKEYGRIVEYLLKNGFSVIPEDINNRKLLHSAIVNGYLNIVEELLKFGADVNLPCGSGCGKAIFPLHVAAERKQEEVARLLIDHGADVNATDGTGKTPIFFSVRNGDRNIFMLLLSNKANIKDDSELLEMAVKRRDGVVAEHLLRHGAPVKDESELMHAAVKNECREVVEYLLQHGACVKDDPEPLIIAVVSGFKDIVEVLLLHGSNVNIRDKYGRTALYLSAVTSCSYTLGCSIADDVDVRREISKMLLSRGANINARTKCGNTALHAAIEKQNVGVIETLMEFNADVNSKNKMGLTPLHIAAEKGNITIVENLLSHGALIDSRNKNGWTALHFASKAGHSNVVECLLDNGSDVNVTDGHRQTALDITKNRISFYFRSLNRFYDSEEDDYDVDRGYCAWEAIQEIFERHIVKRIAANLYVSDRNLQCICISGDFLLRNFQSECQEEVESMKTKKIGNFDISFHDILAKSTYQLAVLLKNKNMVQLIKSCDLSTKFPIYDSMICSHLRMGEKRNRLMEQVSENCFNIFPLLSSDCAEKVLSYLSDEDLSNLVIVCQSFNVYSPMDDTHGGKLP